MNFGMKNLSYHYMKEYFFPFINTQKMYFNRYFLTSVEGEVTKTIFFFENEEIYIARF